MINIKKFVIFVWLTTVLLSSMNANSGEHPKLILTKSGVESIRAHLGSVPLFDATLESVKQKVDQEIALGIDTPIPQDYSGGYTHERHKRNYIIAQQAGALFQILQDEKYATYVRDMLFQYEAMYKGLPVHPKTRSYARGKLFWQCLNDSNWLLYMAQAYDAIYAWLPIQEREQLNNNLFRPFADFISLENPQFYNRIHNHSTWGNAAVGMIGLVMDDEELIHRALYGIKEDGLQLGLKDDDGGFIKVEGQKSGFIANLEEPFSPDGYYTEGPYYQRYAMYPFLMFAVALHNVKPENKILEHKDGVLLKAVSALLNLSDADGEFFPLNDAQKGMSYQSNSLVAAVDIGYYYGLKDPQLLSVAKSQNAVMLDQAGLAVAKAIAEGELKPHEKRSILLRDGADGQQGGVAVLRSNNQKLELIFKYSAQGLSHGHYDKLAISLNHDGDEVLQDYGLVRFVNIEQKGGGNYLKENNSWAKQTVAHNTVVQDEKSHFNGSYDIGSQHHSELHFADISKENIKIVSAKETNAYPGTSLQRTVALIEPDINADAFVIDIVKIKSSVKHQYDLPFYYLGQVIDTDIDYNPFEKVTSLGKENGYQHLFMEAKGKSANPNANFTWMSSGKFFTLTTATQPKDELLFTRIGANDPDFNLRRDPGLLLRRGDTKNTTFATAIEHHGSYSAVSELSTDAERSIKAISTLYDTDEYTAVAIDTNQGHRYVLIISNQDANADVDHRVMLDEMLYEWQGPFLLSLPEEYKH